MKNVAILNNGDRGSTGNIAKNLNTDLLRLGYKSIFCYGRGANGNNIDTYRIDTASSLKMHAFLTRITGKQGFYSNRATTQLLSLFDRREIDTIFVVCIHGYYINESRLYQYVAEKGIRLIHIMIDEYAFTGKCAYRDGCERYLVGCGDCPHKKSYPASYIFDGSASVFKMKQKAYSKLDNAVFVGPQFVVEQALKSPLFHNLETRILDEAIDMSVFCPRPVKVLKDKLGIIVL